ncbi:MAG: hypothetical protein LBH49_01190 [Puniceicoccales bacterium]|jgi:hypothetical protein|nr:hypothetical protein [Puniceicoccales bacterium]
MKRINCGKCSLFERVVVITFLSIVSFMTFDCYGIFVKEGKWTGGYGNSVLARYLRRTLYNVSGGGWNGCGYYAVCVGLNPQSGRYSCADALAIRRIAYPNVSDDADCRDSGTAFSTRNECSGKIAQSLGVIIAMSGVRDKTGREVIVINYKDGNRYIEEVSNFDFSKDYGFNNGDTVILLHRIPAEGMPSGMPHWVVGLPNNLGRASNEFEKIILPKARVLGGVRAPETNAVQSVNSSVDNRIIAEPNVRSSKKIAQSNGGVKRSKRKKGNAFSGSFSRKSQKNARAGGGGRRSNGRKKGKKNKKGKIGVSHVASAKKFNASAKKKLKRNRKILKKVRNSKN